MTASAKRPGGICIVGGHEIALMGFDVDGVEMCHEHTRQLANAFDATLGRPVHERADEASAARVKRQPDINRQETAERILRGREPGFVYYLRIDGLVKIGYARDVTRRMRAYPPTAELLAVHPGTLETEKEMHGKFHGYLARGREWFNPGRALMQHIQVVNGRFGDPSALAYKYRRGAVA